MDGTDDGATGATEATVDPAGAPIPDEDEEVSRKQAALFVAPFLALGLADVLLLLGWGLDPLWGFMILPPILFVSFIAWIAFKYGFVGERTDDEVAGVE